MSGADIYEDGFPHGTTQGFDAGCRGGSCPAGAEHGLSCRRAKTLAAGDYRFQKLTRAGESPAAIADALGLMPEIHAAPQKRVAVPDEEPDEEPDDTDVDDEPEEAPMPETIPTPKDVAPKPKRKSPDGPAQSEVRAWAAENGIPVNPRGSVRKDVVEAYRTAHAGPAPLDPPEPPPGSAAKLERILADEARAPRPVDIVETDDVDEPLPVVDPVQGAALALVLQKWADLRVRLELLSRTIDEQELEIRELRTERDLAVADRDFAFVAYRRAEAVARELRDERPRPLWRRRRSERAGV